MIFLVKAIKIYYVLAMRPGHARQGRQDDY
jgi:hypothetical protein